MVAILEKEMKKAVFDIVVKELKTFPSLKIQIKNKEECKKEGIINLFPVIKDNKKENEIKVRQMERALNGLGEIEHNIIKMKYLNPEPQTDLFIMEELKLKKDAYYEKKAYAIEHIALSLGII